MVVACPDHKSANQDSAEKRSIRDPYRNNDTEERINCMYTGTVIVYFVIRNFVLLIPIPTGISIPFLDYFTVF
jgi:hypothetical protein